MARQLTVRGVPEDVAERLESLSRSRGRSVNSTVLEILKDAVGVHERKKRLARYATWTEEDLADFERALADQRRIDEELWR
ncbi:MAG TPA: Arc family DNA-binding protein [Thermoanaerobaculia bacterium]|jgi:plasmid stability protein